jgi:endonuclease-3
MKRAASVIQRAEQIRPALKKLYPNAQSALQFTDPVQLVVATILSAQCTDARVNMVTPALFARYPDAEAFANAKPAELQRLIYSTGFFRSKAKNIIGCCKQIVALHGGQVPQKMEDLVALPGIGRKTANVILGNAFGIPGIPVDTHVTRLAYRMGLTRSRMPKRIERDLMELVPPEDWTEFGHWMIWHGRKVCFARRPRCEQCVLAEFCPKIGVANSTAKKKRKKKRVRIKRNRRSLRGKPRHHGPIA